METMQDKNYWERLKICQLVSQQMRMERYKMIYVWNFLEGLVPNCKIIETESDRQDTICKINKIKKCPSQIQNLRENSFQIIGPKLFNSLLKNIRKLKNCSVDDFKTELDKFLSKIPDEPKLPGYIPAACDQFSGQPSNCAIDQIRKLNQVNTGGG